MTHKDVPNEAPSNEPLSNEAFTNNYLSSQSVYDDDAHHAMRTVLTAEARYATESISEGRAWQDQLRRQAGSSRSKRTQQGRWLAPALLRGAAVVAVALAVVSLWPSNDDQSSSLVVVDQTAVQDDQVADDAPVSLDLPSDVDEAMTDPAEADKTAGDVRSDPADDAPDEDDQIAQPDAPLPIGDDTFTLGEGTTLSSVATPQEVSPEPTPTPTLPTATPTPATAATSVPAPSTALPVADAPTPTASPTVVATQTPRATTLATTPPAQQSSNPSPGTAGTPPPTTSTSAATTNVPPTQTPQAVTPSPVTPTAVTPTAVATPSATATPTPVPTVEPTPSATPVPSFTPVPAPAVPVRPGTGGTVLVCDRPDGGEGVPYDVDDDGLADRCGERPIDFPGFPALTECGTPGFVLVRSGPGSTATDMCVPGFGSLYDHPQTSPELGIYLGAVATYEADGIGAASSIVAPVLPAAALGQGCSAARGNYVPHDPDGDGIFNACITGHTVWDVPPIWNVFGDSYSVVARHQRDCQAGLHSQTLTPDAAAELITRCTYKIAPGGDDCALQSSGAVVEGNGAAESSLVQVEIVQILCARVVTPTDGQ